MSQRYARAQNTYVWVAFGQVTPTNSGSKVAALVFASKDGTDTIGSSPVNWTGSLDLDNTSSVVNGNANPALNLQIISPVQLLSNIKLEPAGTVTSIQSLPAATSPQSLAGSQLTHQYNGQSMIFTGLIGFTPQGLAKVGPSFSSTIEMDVEPSLGSTSPSNVGAIRINGLTSSLAVYRP